MTRSLSFDSSTLTTCSDGTICENSSTCLPHPTREGSYLCDCLSASTATAGPFAGVYCEFAATSLCTNSGNGDGTAHAFCTNGGECKSFVDKHSQHGGCKCRKGYTGEYCQFVEGSVPSDWEVVNYPSVAAARVGVYDAGMGGGQIAGIVMGSLLGCLLAFGFLAMFIFTGKLAMRIPAFKDKEMDTTTDHEHDEFVGGKSVYIKRRSTKSANLLPATAEMLEADGAVLTDALAANNDALDSAGDSPTKGGALGLQEVNLDELASSLDQDHKVEDLPEIA
ncbi:hypothetical protein HJC23_002660 [Cyclotella cryptica]|uniref:EGF-like domain-containing protein n=1 Tax=Cyclotella cryptica TaxID=29204 RepID=A0ABD3PMF9_9STRA|eukprot:CCRYP_013544-RA/>CCRYP_013544-RA protein AED:0.21 eAED:0.21 QI:0/-1/0/1/-1/1/1/0/279